MGKFGDCCCPWGPLNCLPPCPLPGAPGWLLLLKFIYHRRWMMVGGSRMLQERLVKSSRDYYDNEKVTDSKLKYNFCVRKPGRAWLFVFTENSHGQKTMSE